MQKSVKLLVVDDSKSQLRLTVAILALASRSNEEFDFEIVSEVFNGEDAIKGAKRYHKEVDCIILDFHLRDLLGHDVIKAIRAEGVMTPVVILTSSEHKDDIKKAYRSGANFYFVKPLDARDLAPLMVLLGRLLASELVKQHKERTQSG